MTSYTVLTKDVQYQVDAANPQLAIKDFFRRVKAGEFAVEQMGFLGMVHETEHFDDEARIIPFRIISGLYMLKIIDFETLAANTEKIVGTAFTRRELIKLLEKDRWMTEP